MTIDEIQNEIVDEFSFFDDWEQRYEYLIELGKDLPTMSDKEKTDDKLIKGCQSSVWLDADFDGEKIHFNVDSNAILPKGIAALLLRIYNDQKPVEIVNSNTDFISEIGLQEFLSPTRANGLLAMVKQFKFYAIAFQAKANQ